MAADETSRNFVQPIDLEIRITTPWGLGGRAMQFDLSSPSGRAGFHHREVRGKPIHDPEKFQLDLFQRLEALNSRFDLDPGELHGGEVLSQLVTIGHDLYQKLFPHEMRQIYRQVRDQISTLLITSDEPWIPWEILCPTDDESDDFLCMKFQMSRWLAGDTPFALEKRIEHMLYLGPGQARELEEAGQEIQIFKGLGEATDGLTGLFRSHSHPQEILDLLQAQAVDLLHFAGHGKHEDYLPSESKILLSGGEFKAQDLPPKAEKKLQERRPVVFFNACQVGRLDRSLTGLDGWAPRWVERCACTAFLAPFWNIDDTRAAQFAEAFYRELQGGESLGKAVLIARHELRQEDPDEMTWLAFSLYGYPNARITFGRDPKAPPTGDPPEHEPPTQRENHAGLSSIKVGHKTGASKSRQRRGAKKHSRRFPIVTAASALLALSLLIAENWPEAARDSVNTDPPPVETHEDGTPASSSTPRSTAPPPTEPTTLSLKQQQPAEKPTPRAPKAVPIVTGKIAILVLDRTTRQADREVAEAIQTVLAEALEGADPILPQANAASIQALLDGDLAALPGGEQAPWGAEYLLLATATTRSAPPVPPNPQFTGIELTLDAQLIATRNSSRTSRSSSAHKGLKTTRRQALVQAAERCLRDIIETISQGKS